MVARMCRQELKGTPYRGVRRVGAEPRETVRCFTLAGLA